MTYISRGANIGWIQFSRETLSMINSVETDQRDIILHYMESSAETMVKLAPTRGEQPNENFMESADLPPIPDNANAVTKMIIKQYLTHYSNQLFRYWSECYNNARNRKTVKAKENEENDSQPPDIDDEQRPLTTVNHGQRPSTTVNHGRPNKEIINQSISNNQSIQSSSSIKAALQAAGITARNDEERELLDRIINTYGEETIIQGIQRTVNHGGKSVKYLEKAIETYLHGGNDQNPAYAYSQRDYSTRRQKTMSESLDEYLGIVGDESNDEQQA